MEVKKEVLTVEETCALLTIGRSTLHQYIKKGFFKSYKLGTRVFLMREEVIDAIRANPASVEELEMGIS